MIAHFCGVIMDELSLLHTQTADDTQDVSTNVSGRSPRGSPQSIARRLHHHTQRVLASPPICVPEVQEKTHTKRYSEV